MEKFLELPPDAKFYIQRIRNRCDSLIRSQIWLGIERNRLMNWFRSFGGYEEGEYFAAIILDNLIYRSESQTKALMIQNVQKSIPQLLLHDDDFNDYHGIWIEKLQKNNLPVRLVPVVRENDRLDKSGPAIAKELRTNLGVNEGLFIQPDEIRGCIENGIKLFIFIDDFLGTGDQFSKFYQLVETDLNEDVKAIYTPLCAHSQGLKNVNSKFPSLKVMAAETLSDDHNIFQARDGMLPDGVNSIDQFRKLYLSLLEKRIGYEIEDKFGYGGLGLVYAFKHQTPNSTLPLLWMKKNNNSWLLKRS